MNEHKKRKVRIVCVSDTHNRGPPSGFQLPKGDILVHAGDLTNQGSYAEIERAVAWLKEADFGVKIVVAGESRSTSDEDWEAKLDERLAEMLSKETTIYLSTHHTLPTLPAAGTSHPRTTRAAGNYWTIYPV